ncbi:MAG: hypothetical protein WC634_02855 [archaeon]
MRIGIRKPSIKGRLSARLSPKRYIRHSLGLKAPRGFGFATNPKKFLYNKMYTRTSISVDKLAKDAINLTKKQSVEPRQVFTKKETSNSILKFLEELKSTDELHEILSQMIDENYDTLDNIYTANNEDTAKTIKVMVEVQNEQKIETNPDSLTGRLKQIFKNNGHELTNDELYTLILSYFIMRKTDRSTS